MESYKIQHGKFLANELYDSILTLDLVHYIQHSNCNTWSVLSLNLLATCLQNSKDFIQNAQICPLSEYKLICKLQVTSRLCPVVIQYNKQR